MNEFKIVKQITNGEDVRNMQELDDVLQHYGVKGMKWGVHRSASALRKAGKGAKNTAKKIKAGHEKRQAANDVKNQKYHDKRRGKKVSFYKSDYEKNRLHGMSHKKSMRYARISSTISKSGVAAQLAVAGLLVAGPSIGNTVRGARDLATDPNVVRYGKNLVQAVKRSPIRYVDGAKMGNVLKPGGRIGNWSAENSLEDVLKHYGFEVETSPKKKLDYLMHSQNDNTLLHFGVKGMKWGVHRSVSAKRKAGKLKKTEKKKVKKAKASAKLEKYHAKKKPGSQYRKLYDERMRNGSSHESAIKLSRFLVRANNIALAYIGYKMFSPVQVTPYGKAMAKEAAKSFVKVGSKEAYNRAYNFATDPKVVRAGKNAVLAAKRSNIRVVNAADFDWSKIITQDGISGDTIQHYGVKGMKWGVRKDKAPKKGMAVTLNKGAKRKRTMMNKSEGVLMPAPIALGIVLTDSLANRKVSKKIAGAFDSNSKAFDKQHLKIATASVRQFSDVTLSVDGKTVDFKDYGAKVKKRKSIKQSDDLDAILQHHGVKGMKWGVHRSASALRKAAAGRRKKIVSRVKSGISSNQRERSWSKVNVQGMASSDIQKLAQRAQLENDLKRYSTSKSDKAQYRNRASMSDSEIMDTVNRHRTEANYNRTASEANRSQRDAAKAVVKAVAPVAIKYAMTRNVDSKDVIISVGIVAGPAMAKKMEDKIFKTGGPETISDSVAKEVSNQVKKTVVDKQKQKKNNNK